MDKLDDELGEIPTPAAKSKLLSILAPRHLSTFALIIAALVVAGILWATFSLSSRVTSLEENNIAVQQNKSKELVDINKRLDSVIKALANHLKSHPMSQTDSQESVSTASENTPPALHVASAPLLSSNLPIQPVQKPDAPETSAADSNNVPEPSSTSMAEDAPAEVGEVDPLPIEDNKVEDSPAQVSVVETLPIDGNKMEDTPTQVTEMDVAASAQTSKVDTTPNQDSSIKVWVVNLTSESSLESASREIARLQILDINAQSLRVEADGNIWYRVLVSGFGSEAEANAERLSLEKKLGIQGAWIEQRNKPAPAPTQTSSIKGWVINLTSLASSEAAAQEIARLHNLGIDAQSLRVEAKGKIWYRVLVSGFPTYVETQAARPLLEEKLGIHDTWIEKRK